MMTKGELIDRDKITQLFKAELLDGLKHSYISNDDSGIKLFGEYSIRSTPDNCYVVSKPHWGEDLEFTNAKNATTYCVLHHNNFSEIAGKVYTLDGKLASINLDIAIHTKGYQNSGNTLDHRLIQLTKLQHDLEKKKQIVIQLTKHINTSKETQRAIFAKQKNKRHLKTRNSTGDDKYKYRLTRN